MPMLDKDQLQKLKDKAEDVALEVEEGKKQGAFGESYERGLADGLGVAIGEVDPGDVGLEG